MLEEGLQSALDMWGKNSSYAQHYRAALLPQEGYFTKELYTAERISPLLLHYSLECTCKM